MVQWLKAHAKAVAGFISLALTALAGTGIIAPDSTVGKVIAFVLAALGTYAVHRIPNKPAAAKA